MNSYYSITSDADESFEIDSEWFEANITGKLCKVCGSIPAQQFPDEITVSKIVTEFKKASIILGRKLYGVFRRDFIEEIFPHGIKERFKQTSIRYNGLIVPDFVILTRADLYQKVIRGSDFSIFWKCSRCRSLSYTPIRSRYLLKSSLDESRAFINSEGALVICAGDEVRLPPKDKFIKILKINIRTIPEDKLPENLWESKDKFEFPGPRNR